MGKLYRDVQTGEIVELSQPHGSGTAYYESQSNMWWTPEEVAIIFEEVD